MKFGPTAENLLEWLALKMGKVPVPVIDVLFGPMKARVIMAGVRLGVFDSLAAGPSTARELAAVLKLNAECLEMLLRVLVHGDYLVWDGERFSLSALSRRTLSPHAALDRRGYVEWGYWQWEMMEQLESLMRSGQGLDLHQTLRDPEAWSYYQRGMLEIARDHASYVEAKVPVPKGAKSLIDLGGSHGLLGAAICRKHPPMRSTVYDLEVALNAARELARKEGIGDVVTHRAADILRDDLGSGHDVALLGNILHHFSPEQNLAFLKKVHEALRKGGTVAIWEFDKAKSGSKVTGVDAIALFFRLTSSASAYHGDQYSAWLRETGFMDIRVRRPRLLPGSMLVTARVSW